MKMLPGFVKARDFKAFELEVIDPERLARHMKSWDEEDCEDLLDQVPYAVCALEELASRCEYRINSHSIPEGAGSREGGGIVAFHLNPHAHNPHSFKEISAGNSGEFMKRLTSDTVMLFDDFTGVDVDESKWIPLDGGSYSPASFEFLSEAGGHLVIDDAMGLVGAPIWYAGAGSASLPKYCFLEAKLRAPSWATVEFEVGFTEGAQAEAAKLNRGAILAGESPTAYPMPIITDASAGTAKVREFAVVATEAGTPYMVVGGSGTPSSTSTEHTVSGSTGPQTILIVLSGNDARFSVGGQEFAYQADALGSGITFAPWIYVSTGRVELDYLRVWGER